MTSSPVERRHLGGQRADELGVDDALRRAQVAVRDAALDLLRRGCRARRRSSPRRRCRDVVGIARCGCSGDGRLAAAADRRVDVVHDRRRVGGDRGSRPSPCRCSSRRRPRRSRRPRPRARSRRASWKDSTRRLDARAVVDDDLDALALDDLLDPVGVAERRDAGVGDEQRALDAEALELPAGVGGGAGAELDRRRLEREDGLVVGRCHAALSPARRLRSPSPAAGGRRRRVGR